MKKVANFMIYMCLSILYYSLYEIYSTMKNNSFILVFQYQQILERNEFKTNFIRANGWLNCNKAEQKPLINLKGLNQTL